MSKHGGKGRGGAAVHLGSFLAGVAYNLRVGGMFAREKPEFA